MIVDKPVSPTFSNPIEAKHPGQPTKPIRAPHQHPQPLPPSIDESVFRKLPGGLIEIPSFFNKFDNLIDDALGSLNKATPGCRCPHQNPVDQALKSFHSDIKNMTQKDLDTLKDSLVKRMGSPDSSQTERGLMQKLYEITDAVSEHREAPHVSDFGGIKLPPIRIEDYIINSKPVGPSLTIKF